MKVKLYNQTTLGTYVWSLRDQGVQFDMNWSVIDRGPAFNPLCYVCRLCTLEKYQILFNRQGATLNQRSEFLARASSSWRECCKKASK